MILYIIFDNFFLIYTGHMIQILFQIRSKRWTSMPVHLVIKATPSHITSKSIAKKNMVFNFGHKLILYSKTDKQIHNYTLQPNGICSLLFPCLWYIARYLAANCMYAGSFNHRLFIYQPAGMPAWAIYLLKVFFLNFNLGN